MANTKKSTTKSTTAKVKAVPAKKPAQKPTGPSKKPASYKTAPAKTASTKSRANKPSVKDKSKKHLGEIVFGVIMIVLALTIVAGAILYFCCRNQDVVMIETDGDNSIASRYIEFPDYGTKILIPDNFKRMKADDIKGTKFNTIGETKVSYTNSDKSVLISFSQDDTGLTNDEVKNYTNATKSAFIAANAKDVQSEIREVDGHNIGIIKLYDAQTNASYPYRVFAIYSYDGKVTVANFETNAEVRNSWEKVGDAIISSLSFIEQK